MAMIKLDFNNLHNQKAFTLIELLVAIAIFSIVVAGIVTSRISQQNQSMTQQQVVDVQQTVRSAVSMMIYEIRMAGYNPDVGNYGEGILNAGVGTEADPFTFAYVADDDGVDNNGADGIDEKGELKTLSYFLNGSDLVLNDGGTDKLIAENIEPAGDQDNIDNDSDAAIDEADEANFIFTCLDGSNTPTSVLNNIRAITISITATSD